LGRSPFCGEQPGRGEPDGGERNHLKGRDAPAKQRTAMPTLPDPYVRNTHPAEKKGL
jgi:hypothetical protein